jgi:uncharacterized OB-fold protein
MPETQAVEKTMTLKGQLSAQRDGKILGYECQSCKRRSITPMVRCSQCGKDTVRIIEFAKEGKVLTYTIQNVSSEQFLNEVPFAWVIVELDDGGPRVSGWIPYVAKATDLPAGQRVRFTPSYKPGMMFEKV